MKKTDKTVFFSGKVIDISKCTKKLHKIYLHIVFTTKKKCVIILLAINGTAGLSCMCKKRRGIYD